MVDYNKLTVKRIVFDTGAAVMSGVSVTRQTVLDETELGGVDNPGVGSLYLSSDRMYLRVAAAGAEADWEKVTTTAAD